MHLKVFLIILLSLGVPAMWASEPIEVQFGRGRVGSVKLMTDAETHLRNGDLAAAIQSANTVIQSDPTFFPGYYVRAQVFMSQRKYEQAARDCGQALRIYPAFCEAALLRADANFALGRYDESLKEINHVISIRPRQDALARAYSARAMFLGTCPNHALRNPKQALADANLGCKLFEWRDSISIDDLAAVEAAAGDFDAAVSNEEKALKLEGNNGALTKQMQQHLAAFKRHESGAGR